MLKRSEPWAVGVPGKEMLPAPRREDEASCIFQQGGRPGSPGLLTERRTPSPAAPGLGVSMSPVEAVGQVDSQTALALILSLRGQVIQADRQLICCPWSRHPMAQDVPWSLGKPAKTQPRVTKQPPEPRTRTYDDQRPSTASTSRMLISLTTDSSKRRVLSPPTPLRLLSPQKASGEEQTLWATKGPVASLPP
ncbi:uncharacterized protein LOC119058611 [Artibeus jamaicensis]|uniref:uncharacterized protein LOC119058611 n=1 Tax=Artibeus jamaicensis TaxID=9417 RepID=UPI00235AAEEE|nr:uncharacterized protein LOC119058611 [Artibeus jamaicensis]